MQVRDKAGDCVRVGGCDLALVLRCVLCGLSSHQSMSILLDGFLLGIGERVKQRVNHVVRSPSLMGSPLSNGDEVILKMDVAAGTGRGGADQFEDST